MELVPGHAPTIHFVGVSTKESSIMKVFPRWAEVLGLGDVAINGIDLPLHAPASAYQEVVSFIRDDPKSNGALVTTHKIDLFRAARDLFDEFDWFADSMHEVSSISKRNGKLVGQAKDPISAGRTLTGMLPAGFWPESGGHVFCLGCGGAGVAITWFLLKGEHALGRPERMIVSDISAERLQHLQTIVDSPALETRVISVANENDQILEHLPVRSLVINATGLGKDRLGSPITNMGRLPPYGIIWELNYRGALDFLRQAERAAAERSLELHDGWNYFIHGWTCVIADVFHTEIPADPKSFARLADVASEVSGRKY
jgi:shikimate 5-dehydrogenase